MKNIVEKLALGISALLFLSACGNRIQGKENETAGGVCGLLDSAAVSEGAGSLGTLSEKLNGLAELLAEADIPEEMDPGAVWSTETLEEYDRPYDGSLPDTAETDIRVPETDADKTGTDNSIPENDAASGSEAGAEKVNNLPQEIMDCLNAERTAAGLEAFTWSDDLTAGAAVRSAEAAGSFSHTRPDGTMFYTVCSAAMAENLEKGSAQTQATEIVSLWMSSDSGHRANIMDSTLTMVGISVYEKEGHATICVLFG